MNTFSKYILTLLIVFSCTFLKAQSFITTQKEDNVIVLKEKSSPLSFFVSNGIDAGILRAISNLQTDFEKVMGEKPSILNQKQNSSSPLIIIGTIGTNSVIDDLVKANKIDGKQLKGKNEKFSIQNIKKPFKGVEEAIVIAGSDKRGTIYGIYELAKQIGVSPCY